MNFDRHIIAIRDWKPAECNLFNTTVSNSGLNITDGTVYSDYTDKKRY
jgi:hypothetical protein